MLRTVILSGVRGWAANVGDSLHLLEALGGVVQKLPPPSAARIAALDCLVAAAGAVCEFSRKVRL